MAFTRLLFQANFTEVEKMPFFPLKVALLCRTQNTGCSFSLDSHLYIFQLPKKSYSWPQIFNTAKKLKTFRSIAE